jgi:hypothetical protein
MFNDRRGMEMYLKHGRVINFIFRRTGVAFAEYVCEDKGSGSLRVVQSENGHGRLDFRSFTH